MKFPYGIFDFYKIITRNMFFIDRTDSIARIEDIGDYLLFLRPRRFGKSLLLSMLEHYYDIRYKDKFEKLFGELKIGKTPTPLRNSYFILKWDFSCVDPMGSVQEIKRSLHNHINASIEGFMLDYEGYLADSIIIDHDDAIRSIKSMLAMVRKTDTPIYLLIDEYDNFANEVLMGIRRSKEDYESLVFEEGPLKTLFKAVKSSSTSANFDRCFITGVSPIVMSDITSGYNIAENIYGKPMFNDLCGFKEHDIRSAVEQLVVECNLDYAVVDEAMYLIRTYYNGYRFSMDSSEYIYNPTMVLYFLKIFQETCKFPRQMLDANLAVDSAKLEYISKIPGGNKVIADLMDGDRTVEITALSDRFGVKRLLSDTSKDHSYLVSMLYYFGVVTFDRYLPNGDMAFKIPNIVMQSLYVERMREELLPEPMERDTGIKAAKQLYSKGDMMPLCQFVEEHYFKVFHNRDYRWANELTIKTVFLTLLYNDILYLMDSEAEIGRSYTDLIMIIRPDMRHFDIFDVLIEFKYVKLEDAGISGETARSLSLDELKQLPAMKAQMETAIQQVRSYKALLEKKYRHLRLKTFAVVALGFERVWWEALVE